MPPTSKLSLLANHFENLEKELGTKITIVPEKLGVSSLISDNTAKIEIVGLPVQVEQCRVRVLVVMDEVMVRKTSLGNQTPINGPIEILQN
jgi:hypothetical protein